MDKNKSWIETLSERPYALFAGQTYYPDPGWKGYCGQYATLDMAMAAAIDINIKENSDWWQVVDLRTLEIVAGEGMGHTGLFGKV